MDFKAFVELTRLDHGIIIVFSILLAYVILGVDVSSLDLFVFISSLLVPFLIQIGAFSLNDYLDYKADLINKRMDRPLVRKAISRKTALHIFFISFALAVLLSFSLPKPAFYIALAFAFLSIAYDISLKHLPLIGNIIIALSMGIPFVFANAVVDKQLHDITLILFSMAFVLGLAREFVKDVEDMEGDKKASSSATLPIIIGYKPVFILSAILLVIFLVISLIPFLYFYKPTFFSLSVLLIAYALVSYSIGKLIFFKDPKEVAITVKKYLFYAIIFGLISLSLLSLGF